MVTRAARSGFLSVLTVAMLAVPAVDATADARRDAFARSLSAFIERLRADAHAPPGFVVVAVHGGDTVFERAYGTRDVGASRPVTLETPIYNASSTKAYTGLLAAILDDEGVLPLDASLKDVWPDIAPSSQFDASRITASALLAHIAPLREGGIQFRSNVTGQITAQEVPRRLAAYAVAREAAFRYTNFGPYVWSAMMQAKTGSSWRDMIRGKVFEPLGLQRTSARLEDFAAHEVAHCHAREEGRWNPVPFKPTAILNGAGGIYTSGRDAGRFLQAFVTDGKSVHGRVSSTVLQRTWQRQSVQDLELWGMKRDGYGLGWDLGTYDAHRFVSRSGGAVGCSSMLLFLPDERFGIAVLSLGDAGVNTFNAAIFKQAIDLWTAPREAHQRAQMRLAEYATAAREAFRDADAADPRLARRVELDRAAARAVVGVYENERLGQFTISPESRSLTLTGGVFASELIALGDDEFVVRQHGLRRSEPEVFRLVRSEAGGVTGFIWDDDSYERRDLGQ